MPNWCSNYILIESGDKAKLDEVLDGILDAIHQVDFNKLIPMPAILSKTGHGTREFDGKKHTAWYSEGHGKDDLNRPFTDEEKAELAKIGFTDWYEWSCSNWGTKWNASGTETNEDSKEFGQIEIRYQTAWSAPEPVLAKMCEMFPDVEFTFRCRYEDDHEYPHEVAA
ncbi:hypothetical protein [Rhodopila sp.]|uniref:DUF1281 family ferredoxin-like fold protein n=1 Tax=Rhodopila sp. TaxID=2480087 RepID=UPI003D11F1BA